jgi:hypothetical protein
MLGSSSFKHDMSDAATICFTVPPDAELSFWVKRSTPVESVLKQSDGNADADVWFFSFN